MQKQKSKEFLATPEELARILTARLEQGIGVYTSDMEKQPGGFYKERLRRVSADGMLDAINNSYNLYIGKTTDKYLDGCGWLAESGLAQLDALPLRSKSKGQQ